MRKISNIITLMVVFFSVLNAFSQENSAYNSKWLLKVSGGVNIPLTDMNQNRETDYLIEYSNKTQIAPSVSAIWFIRKRFGIEADFKFIYFNDRKLSEANFIEAVNNQYKEDYFTNTHSTNIYISNNYIPVVSFGLIYRIETERMYFHPKFAIGFTSFYPNSESVKLKEKDSNYEYTLEYKQEKINKDNFTLIPSVSMGYKFSNRFWADLSINTSFFRSNFTYDKILTNLYTNQQTNLEQIVYKKNVFETYASVGIVYVLSIRK